MRGSDADVVYGVRDERRGSAVARVGRGWFWRLFNLLSDTPMPTNVLTERLMTHRYVDALLSLGDCNVFVAGMMYWMGFHQIGIPIRKAQREGRPAYALRHRLALLVEAVTSFSTVPLKLVLVAGLLIMACALLGTVIIVLHKLLNPSTVLFGYIPL